MMADAKIKLVLRGGTLRVRMRGSDGDLSDMLANALADLLAKCYLKGKLDDEGFEAGLERMRLPLRLAGAGRGLDEPGGGGKGLPGAGSAAGRTDCGGAGRAGRLRAAAVQRV